MGSVHVTVEALGSLTRETFEDRGQPAMGTMGTQQIRKAGDLGWQIRSARGQAAQQQLIRLPDRNQHPSSGSEK